MNFTDKLTEHLRTEDEPSNPQYLCFNTGGVEVEVGEFFYGLVRMMKPKAILETGTHKGISAAYMAGALKDNSDRGAYGTITTVEFLEPNYEESKDLFAKLGLENFIKQELKDAASCDFGDTQFDFIFLDTEPQTRFSELVKFYKNLRPGGYLGIHDLHPHMHQIENLEHGFAWPYGPIPVAMDNLVKEKKLVPFHFRTPRGLTMFYKPTEYDHYNAI